MVKNEVDILLVEDNPDDAELTIRGLKERKLANNITWVMDGAEALDFLFHKGKYSSKINHKPKVILLDLKLPKIDGLEVLRQVKKNESTKIIPVVILTSSREEKDIVESYKLGVNSYIVKPVEFEKFQASINEIGFYWLLLNEPPK